jgi:hypothetical protein
MYQRGVYLKAEIFAVDLQVLTVSNEVGPEVVEFG